MNYRDLTEDRIRELEEKERKSKIAKQKYSEGYTWFNAKSDFEIKVINVFDKECRIQRVENNIWEFVDLPLRSPVYKSEEDALDKNMRYKGEYIGFKNLLDDEVIPSIRKELEKLYTIGDCFVPSVEQLKHWYIFMKDWYKYYDGKKFPYWVYNPDPDSYKYWKVMCNNEPNYLSMWTFVFDNVGVSCAFEILDESPKTITNDSKEENK